VDRLLEAIYKSEEAQRIERQSAKADKHRQRLLKRFTRISAVLHSPHPLALLEPIRRYHLSIITYRLERNRLKHRHHAVKTVLRSLRRQHRHTKMQEVYKLFDLTPPT